MSCFKINLAGSLVSFRYHNLYVFSGSVGFMPYFSIYGFFISVVILPFKNLMSWLVWVFWGPRCLLI
jgi:hypothetical protein